MLLATACYGVQGTTPVTGPLPFPMATWKWKRGRGLGRSEEKAHQQDCALQIGQLPPHDVSTNAMAQQLCSTAFTTVLRKPLAQPPAPEPLAELGFS